MVISQFNKKTPNKAILYHNLKMLETKITVSKLLGLMKIIKMKIFFLQKQWLRKEIPETVKLIFIKITKFRLEQNEIQLKKWLKKQLMLKKNLKKNFIRRGSTQTFKFKVCKMRVALNNKIV